MVTHHGAPEYWVVPESDVDWQPNVYADAASLARALRSTRIIDVGCGNADKLVAHCSSFELVGLAPRKERTCLKLAFGQA